MRISSLGFLAITPLLAGCSDQTPLGFESSFSDHPPDYYKFKHPIKKVAIIGAGVGGLISYRELTQAGFDVHVFERDYIPGGNWHYTDEFAADVPIPGPDLAVGDYAPSLPPKGVELPYVEKYFDIVNNKGRKKAHRGPKPIWKSLSSNAPAPIQQIRELPWPAGTAWILPNQKLQRYLRAFASWHGLNSNDNNPKVSYNTRVELAEKLLNEDGDEVGWTLTLKNLVSSGRGTVKATWTKQHFDALIVATGRYNAPYIPNIDGLKAWNDRFPDHIIHSRQYRVPEPYQNQTVLVIGAATSGGEISRDIITHVKGIYQSVRPQITPVPTWSQRDFLRRLPHNVTLVPEIRRFLPPSAEFNQGRVELINGTVITGIDRIILATGYRYTYPFLPQYHNSSLGVNDTAPADGIQPIVTDGTHLRSLYLDAFYIPDPTLVFINANFGMQSFTYAEFTSLASAKIWSGKADFPSTEELWRRYYKLYKERKGYGRHFQFLGAERTHENLRFFQGWLNEAAVKYGGRQIDGLSPELPQISAVWTQARIGSSLLINTVDSPSLDVLGLDDFGRNGTVVGTEPWAQDLVFNDYW
ncbi:hypothetical protein GALMADRAFT_728139 [Galerina marginata CBS 339.88]|uniref:FAD/NAD(P)-binding domain-containing protein n=1 Tax=Galerina marginata (strain CBS 339.88) TaxID=685588 RepID=A0A067T2M3_GALM3|nr:hypothetical protein GALMADRAFT_728139 [Galerina marginata CBS 339.88]